MNYSSPMVVVVCGPSGTGKTTIGTLLAQRLGCSFEEGDSFHSKENVTKMASGVPLNDVDRAPWLQRLRDDVVEGYLIQKKTNVVLACSALKRMYRDVLRGDVVMMGDQPVPVATPASAASRTVFFVLLSGDANIIAARLSKRSGHYMPPSLLASQLATLEPLNTAEEYGMVVDLARTPEEIVEDIMRVVRPAQNPPRVPVKL